ncbi:hypothetical protein LVJ82_17940 [Vitreoscilla massiliensis]|uniref:Uncharacterized protein n=2 Tax=Vitreoscilla massiliensis TaxID=1689272 RepID=A0ABY4E183_9NEIS|nr:hypothetical protein [Vitreoscilla massiliensis]UOO89297.1 hypothetical protein LVJ82_17940 [Vitreoscilla massiliensis]
MASGQTAQAQITYSFEHYPLPPIPSSMQNSAEVQQWRLSAIALSKFRTPYRVENQAGRLYISVGNTQPQSYPVANGQLIFNNRGEWGAQLYFQANGSSNPPLKIKEAQYGNFKKDLTLDGKLYFLEASMHLDGYEGGLFELTSTEQGYDYQEVLHIKDSAPVDVVSYQGAWYIICNNSLYVVKDGVGQRYFYFFYNRMEPNSIAVLDEEHIWVGTNNSGIAKFNLKSQGMKFYLDKHQANKSST